MPLWDSSENGDAIVRSFVATNFVTAMAFLNEVAKVAEEEGHHPDLHLTQYRNVEIRLQTHSMGGGFNTHLYLVPWYYSTAQAYCTGHTCGTDGACMLELRASPVSSRAMWY